MPARRVFTSAVLIAALFAGIATNTEQAYAQYFGQNKVVYETFDFKVLKTEHFDIYYYPQEERAIRDAARMAERWYARLSKFLGFTLQGRQPLILYAAGPQFVQTNVVGGPLGEGTGGVTESAKRRIVLPFAGPLKETDHVIGHELVHAFQYSLSGIRSGRPASQNITAARLPLWFIEGMAEYLSIGAEDPHTAMWMRDAVANMKDLPDIGDLNSPRYFPYRWGQALLAYIAGRWGDASVASLFRTGLQTGNIDASIRRVLSISPDTLAQQWHQALRAAYQPLRTATQPPTAYGALVIGEKKGGGEINIGPVISPDGTQLIFFSERSQFAINLYLADVATGKVTKTIVETELDPHFSSLEFINSAGAWSPDGKQVVFTSVVGNRPRLSILDVDRGDVIREIKLGDIDEAFNPSWSPDGRQIVFSGQIGGYSDLFLCDLQTETLRQLTSDAYADFQPAWSPDGRQIAFVTERFSTDLDNLDIGRYQVAMIEPQSGDVRSIPIFQRGKTINPQWSSDGNSLFVLSDYNGISNVYRYDVVANQAYQVTNLYTGVSGITAISPSFSVAAGTNRLVYTAYEDEKFNIYQIDSPETLAGTSQFESAPLGQEASPALLPPSTRETDELATILNDPNYGLPATTSFREEPYRSRLSIDYVGQPYVAAGFDALGAQLGGGVAFLFSDMLGDHTVATAVQLQTDGGFTDFGGLVGYQNNKKRLAWGGAIQQVPYTTTRYAAGYATVDGEQVYVEQQLSYRQMNREVLGMLSYPFDRVKRVDVSAGLGHISFDQKLETRIFDPFSGALLSEESEELPAMDNISIGTASAAFVYDNAIYGATSPLLGQRFRFEAQPTFGTLTFYALTGDYRRYFMPVRPFTVAVRALHYGRYGKSGEDERLTPLFMGYQDLIRGYNAGSFDFTECQGDPDCPVFQQLFGSKVAVANVELRFPLFGALGVGSGFYGPFPIEVGAFYDIGVAWTDDEKPTFIDDGPRKAVRSYGGLLRANVFGYIIVELDYVKPVDRPEKGAYWQFNISPGF